MPELQLLHIAELEVEVVYKDIKHLHLSVHPPEGRVGVSAPLRVTPDRVHRFVTGKIGWIRRQQRELRGATRHTHSYTDGETHYLWGRPLRLRLITTTGEHHVTEEGERLLLHVRTGTDRAGRERCLQQFYRAELNRYLPQYRSKWEEATGLRATDYRIKYMRTKWGSCTVPARRIWINLELAKHSPECLSYIVLHELLHLRERGHTEAFRALLSRYMPEWKRIRDELNNGFPGLPALAS